MELPTKIYIGATLFNRFIDERNATGGGARLGLLLKNRAGVCIDWWELETAEDFGCEHMPGIEPEVLANTYVYLAKRFPSKTVAGFGYVSSNENDQSLANSSDMGSDLWNHPNVPFVLFSPLDTRAETFDAKRNRTCILDVAVVDDKFKAVKSNKTTLAKAGSKRKTTKTKVHK